MDISLQEFLDTGYGPVSVKAARLGFDPDEVFDGIASDLWLAERDEAASVATEHSMSLESSYHDAARNGIIRVCGISQDEYDYAAQHPHILNRLRSDYLATI